MNIDLHIHTLYSDGTNTTIELLNLIKENDVKIFSVTDHDSVGFYQDFSKLMAQNQVELPGDVIVVPGVEITCQHNHTIRDILGYGIDVDIIQQWLDDNYSLERRVAKQRTIVNRLKQAFAKHGIRFDDHIDAYEGKKSEAYVAMLTNVAKYPENIEKIPEIAHISKFYIKHYTNPSSDFHGDESCDSPTITEAIDLIHQAGGLAFIAHPYKYKMNDKNTSELVELAVNACADGIEVQHCSNHGDDVKKLLEMAEKFNLLASGGTDFHGRLKPEIKLVTGKNNNMKVEYQDIAPWISQVRHFK
jgi:predicted metal-dependent phosphoesterase TrpH